MKLAGRDASRLLAKGILEPESAEAAKVPLQPFELATLRDWREHYETKWAAAPPYDSPLSTAQPALTRTLTAGRARVCRYVLLGPLLPSAQAPEEDDEDADALVVGEQDWRVVDDVQPSGQPQSGVAMGAAGSLAGEGEAANSTCESVARSFLGRFLRWSDISRAGVEIKEKHNGTYTNFATVKLYGYDA